MLTRLTRTMRWRAAVTLALAYLLCVLVPPVARAFVDNTPTVQSVADYDRHDHAVAHAADAKVSFLGDGAAHRHGTHDDTSQNGTGADGHDKAVGCCGYFCMSAAPAAPVQDITPAFGTFAAVAAIDRGIDGRGPGRIDRPPIALLTV